MRVRPWLKLCDISAWHLSLYHKMLKHSSFYAHMNPPYINISHQIE